MCECRAVQVRIQVRACVQRPPVVPVSQCVTVLLQSEEAAAGALPCLKEEGDYSRPFFHPLLLFSVSVHPLPLTRPQLIVQLAQDSCPQPRASLVTGPVSTLTPPGRWAQVPDAPG